MVLLLEGLVLLADCFAHETPLLMVRGGRLRDSDRILTQLLLSKQLLSLLLMKVRIDVFLHA